MFNQNKLTTTTAIWQRIAVVISLLVFLVTAYASKTNDNSSKLIEFLSQEKISLSLSINDAKTIFVPATEPDYLKKLEENEAKIALIHAKIVSFESFLVNQKKIQLDFSLRIKQLQQFPTNQSPQVSLQEKIEGISTLNEINKANN